MQQRHLSIQITAVLAIALFTVQAALAVEFVAHRGESGDAPENTLAAIRLAWQRGALAVEFDVHLTKDGRPIVIHDKDTKRTTGAEHVVAESTLADLRRLDAGAWKDQHWQGERLPTLEEALELTPRNGRAFIEIKVGPEAIPAIQNAIKNSKKSPKQIVIISFNAETIAEAKRRMPEIKAFYLSGFSRNQATGRWSPTIEKLIREADRIGADGLDVSHKGPIDRELVEKVHAAGLKLYVYTVNDAATAQQLIEMGVDGITSDQAAKLHRTISAK